MLCSCRCTAFCRFTTGLALVAALTVSLSSVARAAEPQPKDEVASPQGSQPHDEEAAAQSAPGDASDEVQRVLRLAPSEGNPRNSEGDFISLADGRLLFVYTHFTGGSGDHASAKLVSRVSEDQGATWSPRDRVVVKNEGDWNVMSVSLLRLADDRIALFYMRKNSLNDCRPYVRFSSDEAESWSEPVEIIGEDSLGYYVLNNDRVIQLSGGRLLLPVALHNRPDWQQPDWRGEITCYLSDDAGRSWRRSKTQQTVHDPSGNRIHAQEPGVVELDDQRVMMWIRTGAGQQYQSFSSDRGETWSPPEPMPLASPRSPASIERIPATGDLLAVWNDHAHLEPAQRNDRTPLSIAISRDEGKTWTRSKNIASDPQGWYCYTAIEFVDDQVLLAHVAGQQADGQRLATTELVRFPHAWYYETLDHRAGDGLQDCGAAEGSASAESGGRAELVRVQKIWDEAPHNAFTDLVRFEGKWFCVFREGSGHVSPDGALRVIVSQDGHEWKSAARITSDRADLRDAKLSVTPTGQLMLSGAAALHDRSEHTHQSLTWFSDDGVHWSEPHEVGDPDVWLWRVNWHNDTAYGLGYSTGGSDDRFVRLYRSGDGKQFDTVVDRLFDTGYPNESSLVFLDDGTCYCLLRRDGGTKTGQLGIAHPPYREWTWKDLGVRIGGPDMIRLPDGRLLAAVRLYDGGARTSLCWIDPSSGTLSEFLELPSGGDTSYAGLVWHEDRLWVSYYATHEPEESEAKTSIYLAEVAIAPAGDAAEAADAGDR